jgi:hypothetical protein
MMPPPPEGRATKLGLRPGLADLGMAPVMPRLVINPIRRAFYAQ